ncbi:hypothetical protein TNCV_490051 [Trichonephila clavipes]|nr:hypothetical protein TNCV_490051 [Trichonephila clavipes]
MVSGMALEPLQRGKSILSISHKCSSPVTNRGCNFSPSMNSSPSIANAASVIAQLKKDRVPGLRRGPGLHHQKISRLNFSVEDRSIKIRASRIVHCCRSDTHRRTSIFIRDFRGNELEAAIGDSCLNKSPGPNGIHCQMIDHLGLSGRQRFLDIINCSWNKGQLPRDWRRVIVIPIKKCGKTDGTPESYRTIALYKQYCLQNNGENGFEKTHFSPAFPQSSLGETVRFQRRT